MATEATQKRRAELLEHRRTELLHGVETGTLTIPQTIRLLRKSLGMSIPEYAVHVGVSKRYLGDIERGLMNPSVDILDKIGQPLGLVVGFRSALTG